MQFFSCENRSRFGGLALGTMAMWLLLLPEMEAVGQELSGALLMIAGAISWGVATIIVKGVD